MSFFLWCGYVLSSCIVAPVLYWVVRYRRGVVRRNLEGALNGLTIKELRSIERRFYSFFSDLIFESIWLGVASKGAIRRRMRFEGVEKVVRSLDEGRSIVLFLGHLGCWEWVSSMPLHLPEDVVAGQVYKQLNNKLINNLLLNIRRRMGAECIEMRDVARRMRQLAGQKSIVGFIADQSPRKKQATHFIPFLGHSAPVFTGPEKIALKYGADAWYLDMRRVRRGFYEAQFVKMETREGMTEEYYRLLEKSIYGQPEIYLWSHKRFKHAKRD